MYEEYMQNLLGMQINPFRNTYEQMVNNSGCCMGMNENSQFESEQPVSFDFMANNSFMRNDNVDLESMYPDIYKIVYPMVRKACMQNTRPITRELIEEMSQEIYNNIQSDNVVNLNINIDNSTNTRGEINDKVENKSVENRQVESREFNRGLSDLIRILLLREFIGRPGWQSPNHPRSMPPRPPHSGGWRPMPR